MKNELVIPEDVIMISETNTTETLLQKLSLLNLRKNTLKKWERHL